MRIKSDLEIAQSAELRPIEEIAEKLGIEEAELLRFGKYKAKIESRVIDRLSGRKNGKLILVTAINPTAAGEGKTTTTVGLGDALSALGKNAVIAIREPSLGPVFGLKGGAAGGGYAQVIPMEDLNLHFTGDLHAVTAANNLIAAMLDNHIYQGNELQIDIDNIVWKRCLDMNDRQLRYIEDGLGGPASGVKRRDGFNITAASEIMAVLCLSENLEDLKNRIARIIVAYDINDKPVTAKDLKAEGAAAALLYDAVKPNLVQTLEHTPALVHGGPFANIAHGCNSVIATKMALHLSDYAVTEAGFGADLGAEKFLDIKCRASGLVPDAVVIVATARALKLHGGVKKENLNEENLAALEAGMENLLKHIENMTDVFGLPVVVAVNRFPTDTEAELGFIEHVCKEAGTSAVLSEVWEKGSRGGLALAAEVIRLTEEKKDFHFAYDVKDSIENKLHAIATKIYGAEGVDFTEEAKRQVDELATHNLNHLPVCVAKTQYSLSDDASRQGRPKDFRITVREIRISAGAGFIVALTGSIMTMPGLPKRPAAEKIDVDVKGRISGLF